MSPFRALGLSAVAAVALALSAPLAASAAPVVYTTTYSVDCDVLANGSYQLLAAPSDTVTLEVVNCSAYEDTDGAYHVITTPTLTMAVDDWYYIYNEGGDYVDVSVAPLYPETVPTGELLATQDATIAASPSVMDVGPGNNPDDPSDTTHYLAGDEACALNVETYGDHVYGVIEITVDVAGTFTFRGIGSDPASNYMGFVPPAPIADPFLALYEGFDPASPDAGVVGCNDDLNDLFEYDNDEMGELISSAGNVVMEGHQPLFSAELEPGQYSLVLMTWEEINAADWQAGTAPYTGAYTAGAEGVTFQMWGPENGLRLGHLDPITDPVDDGDPDDGGEDPVVDPAVDGDPAAEPQLAVSGGEFTAWPLLVAAGVSIAAGTIALVLRRRRA